MSARIFPWLEEAPRPDQMAEAPARKPEEKRGREPLRKRSGNRKDAAKTQRRRWDRAKIV